MSTLKEAKKYYWKYSEQGKGLQECYNDVKAKYGKAMAEKVRKSIKIDAYMSGGMYDFPAEDRNFSTP